MFSELSILSLNIMHGRARGRASLPLAYSKKALGRSIGRVAAVVRAANADVVALQEVDGPSFVNGYTDQVAVIADLAGYTYRAFAPHTMIRSRGRNIHVAGTAVLSRYPISSFQGSHFPVNPSRRFRKGYVAADINLPNGNIVTVVSAHFSLMDSPEKRIRLRESRYLAERLQPRTHPIIIAGDFNCGHREEWTISHLATALGLHAPDPRLVLPKTFPSWKPLQRIDWILPSLDLTVLEEKVVSHRASDHAAVFARLKTASHLKN